MKPRILILYYSQTGQLRQILDSITQDIKDKAEIDYVAIEPETPYPFPWSVYTFFDAMPETVKRIPVPIKPVSEDVMTREYDLVILGYQPWFLHPSQPVTSFMKSKWARLLKGKNVLTVIGCRNMWLNAQEKIKSDLQGIGANHVGNIVLVDQHTNLVSLLTILRWMLKGQKEPSKRLPEAGVSTEHIQQASRFGNTIHEHVINNSLGQLQDSLLKQKAVELVPGLIILENRGVANFGKFAEYISAKGGPGAPERKSRVMQFKNLLIVAIFVLSPITSFTAYMQLQLKKRKLLKDVEYFKQVDYEAGRL